MTYSPGNRRAVGAVSLSAQKRTSMLMIVQAAIAFSAPLFLESATAGQQNDAPVDEIQVTATRRAVSTKDVSAALTIVTAKDIAAGKLVTDSLVAQPGVFVQQTTPGQGSAIIRGLKGSEVLHLVDGMRLNNAIFRNAPTQYLALVAPGTLERVEVLRGAPASLYGSDAVGGVIQVISRIPSFDSAGMRREAFLSYDSGDLSRTARASFEVGNETLAALLSGEYLQTGNRRTGGGARIGPAGYKSKGARIALSATPDDRSSWLFDLQFAQQPLTPRIDELVPGYGETQPSSVEFLFAPNERDFAHVRHVRKDWLAGATWNFDIGWQRIVDDRISRDYLSDIRRHETNRSDLLGLSFSASGDTGSGSWIAGAEYYHDEVRSTRLEENLLSGQIDAVTARFPDDATVDQAAIFGNLLRELNDRHTVSAGLRLNSVNIDLPASGTLHTSSIELSDFSADAGWTYNLSANTQLVANIGYGFRAPNVFDLGTLGERPGNRFNIPNPSLLSERITQVDFGVRHRAETWDLDLVFFALHYSDRITSVLTGDVTTDGRDITQSRNVERANIRGVEFSGHWYISERISGDLVVNMLRGDQSEPGSADVPGDRIPPLNGKLSMQLDWTDELSISPYLRFALKQNRLSPRDARDVRINPEGTPGWLTANIAATWQASDAITLSATLENIFDQRYRWHGSGIDALGRSFYVSARSSW